MVHGPHCIVLLLPPANQGLRCQRLPQLRTFISKWIYEMLTIARHGVAIQNIWMNDMDFVSDLAVSETAYSGLNFFSHVFLISKASLLSRCSHAAVSHFSRTFADGLIEQKSNDRESGGLDSRFVFPWPRVCICACVRFTYERRGIGLDHECSFQSVWIPVMLSAFKVLHSRLQEVYHPSSVLISHHLEDPSQFQRS